MKLDNLANKIRGWFVGHFPLATYKTDAFEVAVMRYKRGDKEPWHIHKIATELTVVVSGAVRMVGRELHTGDIIQLDPGEGTDFEALSDAWCVVVKTPSVIGDKYIC